MGKGVKAVGTVSYHLCLSNVEIKNEWICTSTTPHVFVMCRVTLTTRLMLSQGFRTVLVMYPF